MANLLETVDTEAEHLCIFGEPFTGKSTLASSVAALGFKVLWFSLDGHHGVLRKLPVEAQKNINLIRILDTRDNPIAILTANKVMTGAPVMICQPHGLVDCSVCRNKAPFDRVAIRELGLDTIIVWDHITQVADSALAAVIKKAIKDGEKDATGAHVKDIDEFKPAYSQFMQAGFLMTKFLTNVQAARNHIICIAHVAEIEQEDGRKKLVPLVGSIPYSRNSPKYFDHLISCELYNRSHKINSTTTANMTLMSGSRTDIDISAEKVVSLRPFFAGIIPKLGSYGEEAAKAVLAPVATPAAQAVEVEAKEEPKVEEKKVTPEPAGITAATDDTITLPEQPAAAKVITSSSADIKAALAKLRNK